MQQTEGVPSGPLALYRERRLSRQYKKVRPRLTPTELSCCHNISANGSLEAPQGFANCALLGHMESPPWSILESVSGSLNGAYAIAKGGWYCDFDTFYDWH